MISNANDILFHPSSYGKVMTGVAKGWSVENSLTCKQHLYEIFRAIRDGRKIKMDNKYLKKGRRVEEDALTLISRFRRYPFHKNSVRLENEFFTGEIDTFTGKEILRTKETIDTKASWDYSTFPSIYDKPDTGYEYQGLCYMDLSGAEKHTVAYCLVNTPGHLIAQEKRNLLWSMGTTDETEPSYIERCIEIERDSIFDLKQFLSEPENEEFKLHNSVSEWVYDIPVSDRIREFSIDRDQKKIDAMHSRAKESREFMNREYFKIAV